MPDQTEMLVQDGAETWYCIPCSRYDEWSALVDSDMWFDVPEWAEEVDLYA